MIPRRLPDHIINQIAAGEVVGAPSSVVKELLENALDAGASRIDITIEHAGMALIRVKDNGHGIQKDHLPLIVQQHTTSKMPDNCIETVTTLGFRGEALPSIGAVSRMTVTSKTALNDAWSLTLDAGKSSQVTPASLDEGTCVEVTNIFYPTPARLKFLKSPATETHANVTQVQHLALAAPHAHISLRTENKTLLNLSPGTSDPYKERAGAVLHTHEDLVPLSFSTNQASLKGFVGVPTHNRRTSDRMFFLVNNRCCSNRAFLTSARYAFGDLIPKGRFPVAALWLEVPQEDVDVNAHPSKMDVRFRNPQHIRHLIETAINEQLNRLEPHTSQELSEKIIASLHPFTPPSAPHTSAPSFSVPLTHTFTPLRATQTHTQAPTYTTPVEEPKTIPLLGFPRCQLHKTYIISEVPDAIIITDQHAAHERIVYEDMKQKAYSNTVASQTLLAPIVLQLSETESAVLQPLHHHLERWGFALEFSTNGVVVSCVPADLKSVNIAKVVEDFFSEIITQDTSKAPEEALHALCSTTACHTSIRAGQDLSLHEMSDLLRTIERTPAASQCNHGRPTHIRLSKTDMDLLFER